MSKLRTMSNQKILDDDGLLDKIAIEGEVMEIGGNVAIENIEQFGYMKEETTPAILSIKVPPYKQWPEEELVMFTGVEEHFGQGWEQAAGYQCPEGGVILTPGGEIVTKIGGVLYLNYGGQSSAFGVKGVDLKVVEGVGEIIIKEFTPSSVEKYYNPFFTEEQYQALLDLIENK